MGTGIKIYWTLEFVATGIANDRQSWKTRAWLDKWCISSDHKNQNKLGPLELKLGIIEPNRMACNDKHSLMRGFRMGTHLWLGGCRGLNGGTSLESFQWVISKEGELCLPDNPKQQRFGTKVEDKSFGPYKCKTRNTWIESLIP